MSIEKTTAVDKIEVLENGCIQVRTATKIIEDGVEISRTFSRKVIAPGADYSEEDARVQAICIATHTPEVIDAYKAAMAAEGV